MAGCSNGDEGGDSQRKDGKRWNCKIWRGQWAPSLIVMEMQSEVQITAAVAPMMDFGNGNGVTNAHIWMIEMKMIRWKLW